MNVKCLFSMRVLFLLFFDSGQGKDLEEFFESTAGIILGENEDKTVEILFFKRLFCLAELALHHVTLGINSILHL